MTNHHAKKLVALLILVAGMVITACDDDEKVYGNDGAALAQVDLSNAIALVSERGGETFTHNGISFRRQTLMKVDAGGGLSPATFTISGNQNGGFDWYTVNDINEDYFLISFYRRAETYFVHKSTGAATKSAFMEVDDLSFEDQRGFGVFGENILYYRDAHLNHFRVDDFLSGDAVSVAAPGINVEPDHWYFDQNGEPYFADGGKLFHYTNGVATQIASGSPLNLWNDLEGVLRMIDANGKISLILDGDVLDDGDTGIPLTSTRFRTFNFPGIPRQIAVFTSFTGPTLLYDLGARQTIMSIDNGNDYFDIMASDAFGSTITLLSVKGTQPQLTKININAEEPQINSIFLSLNDLIEEGNLYAVSENMTIIEVTDGPASRLIFENSQGTLRSLDNREVSGNVIPLR